MPVPSATAMLDDELMIAVMVREAYRHHKTVGAIADGRAVLDRAGVPGDAPGVVVGKTATKGFASELVKAVGWHRHSEPPTVTHGMTPIG